MIEEQNFNVDSPPINKVRILNGPNKEINKGLEKLGLKIPTKKILIMILVIVIYSFNPFKISYFNNFNGFSLLEFAVYNFVYKDSKIDPNKCLNADELCKIYDEEKDGEYYVYITPEVFGNIVLTYPQNTSIKVSSSDVVDENIRNFDLNLVTDCFVDRNKQTTIIENAMQDKTYVIKFNKKENLNKYFIFN
jgi:hypothetical protein